MFSFLLSTAEIQRNRLETRRRILVLRPRVRMHHRADDHARLVRAIAPRVVNPKHSGCVTGLQQGLVRVAHEVDLAVGDRKHIAGISRMHAGMTVEILFSGGILLLHLLVEFLKDLNMFLGILDIRRYLQGAEDQAVFGGFAYCDIGSTVSTRLVVDREFGCRPECGAPKDVRNLLVIWGAPVDYS